MTKKLIGTYLALAAAAAFALPASASAANDPQLTDAGGTVAVGSKVIYTLAPGTAADMMNTDGTTVQISCTSAVLTGTVVKNAGGTVESTISTADFSGTGPISADNGLNECTASIGNAYITVTNLPLCLRSTPTMAEDEFQISSSDCGGGGGPIKFVWGSTVAGECEYEFTNAISGTHTTNGTVATVQIRNTQAGSGYKKIKGGVFCPSSWQFRMEFNLYTDVAGEPPITIS